MIQSVIMALKEGTTTLSNVRTLFDGTIDIFPSFSDRLLADKRIFHSPEFEVK